MADQVGLRDDDRSEPFIINGQTILQEPSDDSSIGEDDSEGRLLRQFIEIQAYAEMLGVDLDNEPELEWIVLEGVRAKLPSHFRLCEDQHGQPYYYDFVNNSASWEHPTDGYYKQMVAAERDKAKHEMKQQQLQQKKQQQHHQTRQSALPGGPTGSGRVAPSGAKTQLAPLGKTGSATSNLPKSSLLPSSNLLASKTTPASNKGRSMLTKQTTVTQARQTILESEEDEDESSDDGIVKRFGLLDDRDLSSSPTEESPVLQRRASRDDLRPASAGGAGGRGRRKVGMIGTSPNVSDLSASDIGLDASPSGQFKTSPLATQSGINIANIGGLPSLKLPLRDDSPIDRGLLKTPSSLGPIEYEEDEDDEDISIPLDNDDELYNQFRTSSDDLERDNQLLRPAAAGSSTARPAGGRARPKTATGQRNAMPGSSLSVDNAQNVLQRMSSAGTRTRSEDQPAQVQLDAAIEQENLRKRETVAELVAEHQREIEAIEEELGEEYKEQEAIMQETHAETLRQLGQKMARDRQQHEQDQLQSNAKILQELKARQEKDLEEKKAKMVAENESKLVAYREELNKDMEAKRKQEETSALLRAAEMHEELEEENRRMQEEHAKTLAEARKAANREQTAELNTLKDALNQRLNEEMGKLRKELEAENASKTGALKEEVEEARKKRQEASSQELDADMAKELEERKAALRKSHDEILAELQRECDRKVYDLKHSLKEQETTERFRLKEESEENIQQMQQEFTSTLDSLRESQNAELAELNEELAQKKADLEADMEEVDSQLAHTRATRNGNAQAVKDLDSARAEIEAARQALEKDRADLDTAKKSTQREEKDLADRSEAVRKQEEALSEKTASIEDQKASLLREREALEERASSVLRGETELTSQKAALDQLNSSLQSDKGDLAQERSQLDALRLQLQKAQEALEETRKTQTDGLVDVNLDGRQLEKEIADLREQRQIELEALDAAKRERHTLLVELEGLRGEVSQLQDRRKEIHNSIAAQKSKTALELKQCETELNERRQEIQDLKDRTKVTADLSPASDDAASSTHTVASREEEDTVSPPPSRNGQTRHRRTANRPAADTITASRSRTEGKSRKSSSGRKSSKDEVTLQRRSEKESTRRRNHENIPTESKSYQEPHSRRPKTGRSGPRQSSVRMESATHPETTVTHERSPDLSPVEGFDESNAAEHSRLCDKCKSSLQMRSRHDNNDARDLGDGSGDDSSLHSDALRASPTRTRDHSRHIRKSAWMPEEVAPGRHYKAKSHHHRSAASHQTNAALEEADAFLARRKRHELESHHETAWQVDGNLDEDRHAYARPSATPSGLTGLARAKAYLEKDSSQHAPAPSKAFEDFSDDDVISTNSVSSETDSMSLDTESLLADRAPMPSTGVDTQVLMNRHRAKLSATSPLRSSRHVTESLGMRTNSRYTSDVRRSSTRPSVKGQASIQTHAVTESQPSEGVLSSLQNINTSISTLISDMQGKGHSAVPSASFVPAIDAAASRTLPTHALQHHGTMTSEDILSYQSPAIRSLDNVIKERSVKDAVNRANRYSSSTSNRLVTQELHRIRHEREGKQRDLEAEIARSKSWLKAKEEERRRDSAMASSYGLQRASTLRIGHSPMTGGAYVASSFSGDTSLPSSLKLEKKLVTLPSGTRYTKLELV